MSKSKQELNVEADVILDICVITKRTMSDVQNTAKVLAMRNKSALISVLDGWLDALLKDPSYILPGDKHDPRHPETIRKDRENDV